MNKKVGIIALLCATFVSGARAELSNKQFINNFIPHFSKMSCSDKGVLRRCFRVKQKVCLSSAAVAAERCKRDLANKIPRRLVSTADSGYWGGRLASCISKHFGQQNISAINKTDRSCADLTVGR